MRSRWIGPPVSRASATRRSISSGVARVTEQRVGGRAREAPRSSARGGSGDTHTPSPRSWSSSTAADDNGPTCGDERRTDHPASRAERRREDGQLAGRLVLDRRAGRGGGAFPIAVDETEPAPDHHGLRIEGIHERRERAPELVGGRIDDRGLGGITEHSSARSTPARSASARPPDVRSTGGAPTTIAFPRAPSVRHSVEHEAVTDPGADDEVHERVEVRCNAEPCFAQRCRDVGFDAHARSTSQTPARRRAHASRP